MKSQSTVLLLCLLFASCALSQCPGGRCPLPGRQAAPVVIHPQPFEWKVFDDRFDYLYRGGQLVGAWDHVNGVYWPRGDGFWSWVSAECPCLPPIRPQSLPTGVDRSKLLQHGERFSVSGVTGSRETAFEALGNPGPGLKDDKDHWYLSIIAKDAAARAKLVDEILKSKEFEAWKGKLHVWDAEPDHWSLRPGFKKDTDGVYLQTPTGEVVHRQESLESRSAIEGLRKADPNYDPSKDTSAPLLNRLKKAAASEVDSYLFWGVVIVIAALVIFTLSGRKKTS